MTGDISAGGIFVPTDENAEVGEKIEIELSLPDDRSLNLLGTVVAVVDRERAEKLNKKPGLGIRLEAPTDEKGQAEFLEILARARAAIPAAPDELPDFDEAVPDKPASEAPPLAAPELSPAPEPTAAPSPAPAAPAPAVFARTPGPDPIVGIDFGNTYTSVAVSQGDRIAVLRDADNRASIATVVTFPGPGEIIVGNEARARLVHDPKHTIASPKRIIGQSFRDRDVEQILGRSEFVSREGPDGAVIIEMWGEVYALPQICSYVLNEVKSIAERHLQREVRRAVLTVPANFGPPQIEALKRAAALAHLEIVAMLDEPTAAALANRNAPGFGGVIAIYDFGGGTLDVSLVDVSGGDLRVLVTGGDNWLGGDDFDLALTNVIADKLWRRHRVELRQRAVELQKLLFASERVKRELSVKSEAVLHAPELLRTPDGLMDVRMTIDRRTFRELCEPVISQSLQAVTNALAQAGIGREGLSTIYLSGGSTHVPAVRNALHETFGVPVRAGVAPEHAGCVGAAIYAAHLQARLASPRD